MVRVLRWVVALTCAFASAASAQDIRVAAAISLREAMQDVATLYEQRTGTKVAFVFGASGQLAAQIDAGAPVDLFVSAAAKQVDDLQARGLVDGTTRAVVAGNTLVLVVPASAASAPKGFADLATAKRVAIGEPKTVPAGQYAQQSIASLKLADALKGKLIYGANVRQVLSYVERGEVDAGLVYATDAIEAGDAVKVVATADASTHEPIVYPAAVVTASKKQDATKAFLQFLTTDEAQAKLRARGFAPPPAAKQPTTAPRSAAPALPDREALSRAGRGLRESRTVQFALLFTAIAARDEHFAFAAQLPLSLTPTLSRGEREPATAAISGIAVDPSTLRSPPLSTWRAPLA
jgi:molybdate transport system substrate-binding protein